ncbi:MAG: hypothetical protein GXO07_00820 [Crenarchaeota archaeon]|nr:hypothetical protein [Thermoproteota archaeon]
MLLLSAAVIVLSAYQASAEAIPEMKFLGERAYLRGRRLRLAEAAVEEVELSLKGPAKVLALLPLRHAREYLAYEAWGPAVYEASRAYRLIKKLLRTTSSRARLSRASYSRSRP